MNSPSRWSAALGMALCLIWLAGCASRPPIDWNSRLGNYTYDQAVMEFGPPDRTATLADGSTVAEWYTERLPRSSIGIGTGVFGGSSIGTGISLGTAISPGARQRVLRLAFDPTGLLREARELTR